MRKAPIYMLLLPMHNPQMLLTQLTPPLANHVPSFGGAETIHLREYNTQPS